MADNNGFFSVQQFEKDVEFFNQCADKAKKRGLLSLEDEVRDMEEGFHKTALTMVIDNHNPQLIEQVLSERAKTLSFIYQRRLEMAITAVLSIQAGDTAKVTTMKCKAFYSESEK
jgi:flagellar motor component MotA